MLLKEDLSFKLTASIPSYLLARFDVSASNQQEVTLMTSALTLGAAQDWVSWEELPQPDSGALKTWAVFRNFENKKLEDFLAYDETSLADSIAILEKDIAERMVYVLNKCVELSDPSMGKLFKASSDNVAKGSLPSTPDTPDPDETEAISGMYDEGLTLRLVGLKLSESTVRRSQLKLISKNSRGQ